MEFLVEGVNGKQLLTQYLSEKLGAGCLFSQGNTVLSIAVLPKNQIIWILDTSAQNWRHSAKPIAHLEKNIVQHHSFIRLSVYCDKFRKWGGLRCCTLCLSVSESPSFNIPSPYKLAFHLIPVFQTPVSIHTYCLWGNSELKKQPAWLLWHVIHKNAGKFKGMYMGSKQSTQCLVALNLNHKIVLIYWLICGRFTSIEVDVALQAIQIRVGNSFSFCSVCDKNPIYVSFLEKRKKKCNLTRKYLGCLNSIQS